MSSLGRLYDQRGLVQYLTNGSSLWKAHQGRKLGKGMTPPQLSLESSLLYPQEENRAFTPKPPLPISLEIKRNLYHTIRRKTWQSVLHVDTTKERQLNGAESARILLNSAQGKAPTQSSDGSGGRVKGKGRGKRDSGGRDKKSKMMCSYCGKQGQDEDICFKKHGYPPYK
ncbi:hypothetical protein PIB30_002007 [Stylosanthes scabra]|uniref:Uncharacterized protein n=1 Tax=Stylosanthes scabra TaxID=79078 RepID=A0ABU6Q3U7_9FABA|nr:hypothetical protein [Stylosanthes scabra]